MTACANSKQADPRVVDSHTGGEPTRGGDRRRARPRRRGHGGSRPLARLSLHFDALRSAVVNEPRGSDVAGRRTAVRAGRSELRLRRDLLQQRRLSRHVRARHDRPRWCSLAPSGPHRTRASTGSKRRSAWSRRRSIADGSVACATCRAIVTRKRRVSVEVPGYGAMTGDVAWGGNWFFLVAEHGHALELRQRAKR